MKNLLITGFDPFGGEKINPAWEAVKLLPDTIGDYRLTKLEIPTVFGKAAETVLKKAEEVRPQVILCIGQAGGRAAVTPERVAINLRDAKITDNERNQPVDEACVSGGPTAYFATVPVKAMVQAMTDAGFPAAVSNTAGTFVCNDTLYTLLHRFNGTDVRCGFIHVPYLPQQGTPSLELERTAAALEAAVQALDR